MIIFQHVCSGGAADAATGTGAALNGAPGLNLHVYNYYPSHTVCLLCLSPATTPPRTVFSWG